MPSLTIGWEYLTGYAVATDPSSRDRPEWPPHPGRVFMALSAAWFETESTGDNDDECRAWRAEGEALRELEKLGDPVLHLPARDHVFPRSVVTAYVPVNDKAGPASATLQSVPSLTRSKQPRSFPRTWVGDTECFMCWPDAELTEELLAVLGRLCGKVTRIGHSSSLVRMWVADDRDANLPEQESLVADEFLAEDRLRSFSPGMVDMLADRFGEEPRRRHANFSQQIETLKASKKLIKGKGSKDRKASIDVEISQLSTQLSEIVIRPPIRPTLGLWSGYRRHDHTAPSKKADHTLFDTDILVLRHVEGPRLPVVSTLAVTRALRNTVMSQSNVKPIPPWVSGHEANGEPLSNDSGHLACIPLPFVSTEYADGHLLGVGLVFPQLVSRRDRAKVLGKVLLEDSGEARRVKLKLGQLVSSQPLASHWLAFCV